MLLLLPIIGKTAYLGEVEGRTVLSTSGSPHYVQSQCQASGNVTNVS